MWDLYVHCMATRLFVFFMSLRVLRFRLPVQHLIAVSYFADVHVKIDQNLNVSCTLTFPNLLYLFLTHCIWLVLWIKSLWYCPLSHSPSLRHDIMKPCKQHFQLTHNHPFHSSLSYTWSLSCCLDPQCYVWSSLPLLRQACLVLCVSTSLFFLSIFSPFLSFNLCFLNVVSRSLCFLISFSVLGALSTTAGYSHCLIVLLYSL